MKKYYSNPTGVVKPFDRLPLPAVERRQVNGKVFTTSVGLPHGNNTAMLLLRKVLTAGLCLLILYGCASTGTLPNSAQEMVLKNIVYDPHNYFGGCQVRNRDCKDVNIIRAYELEAAKLPEKYQHADTAWCVQWQVFIQHPINHNYERLRGWAVVFRQDTTFSTLNTDAGSIDGDSVCW